MRLFFTFTVLLAACSNKHSDDDRQDDSQDVLLDADGDGFVAAEDCDDNNPLGWLAPDELAGDLTRDFEGFCAGYCVRSLQGDLNLTPATAEDVASLTCLNFVGGDVKVSYNSSLKSLSGLEALTSVSGSLDLSENPTLESLSGLDGLSSVGGDLVVSANGVLMSLSGLGGLRSVGGSLNVYSSAARVSLLGLGALSSVGGCLQLHGSGALTSLAVGAGLGKAPRGRRERPDPAGVKLPSPSHDVPRRRRSSVPAQLLGLHAGAPRDAGRVRSSTEREPRSFPNYRESGRALP